MAVMHNDVEYNFRQDSDFIYLTGFNESGAIAVFAPHHEEHHYILFVEPKDLEKEIWTGYRIGVDAAKEQYQADIVYPIAELDEQLPQYLEQCDRIFYRFGRNAEVDGTVMAHWQSLLRKYPKTGRGPIAIEDPIATLHPIRNLKSNDELEIMRQAANLSVAAHLRAMEFAQPGRYEYEVQAEIEYLFQQKGCLPAYPSIIASGGNACILHYTENTRQMQDNELLLIDAGASYQYYNGDITRTFPVGGKFTPEQKLIYEIVLAAQEKAIAEVRPDSCWQSMHDVAIRTIVEGLMDLKLLQGDIEEIITEEKYKPFYMHRTGHWIGLDVHDVGIYQEGDDPYNFMPGQVVTVEPGIYISPYIKPAEGQPEVDPRWHGIGVRIEDDVLVVEQGHEVLTAGVPKAIADLEH
jgi:Xaa-Pro aminopeptidase